MDPVIIGVIGCVALVVLIIVGIHIGFALACIGFVGIVLLRGWSAAFGLFQTVPYYTIATYAITPLPLFVLMASLCLAGGISATLFRSMRIWLSKVPAPMGVATAFASALFGMLTGTSMVIAAMFTRLAAPEMLKFGYNRQFAIGLVAGTSILGMLIPPSLFAILYGIISGVSIARLFMAGIIPGIVTLISFSTYIMVRAKINPRLAPPDHETYSFRDRLHSLSGVWPILVVALLMLGGIFSGLFTVTEGASIGVIGTLIVLVSIRRLTSKAFMAATRDTVGINCMIGLLLIGVAMFSRFIAMSGVTSALCEFLMGLVLPGKAIIAILLVVYLIMGCFFDVTAMMIMTVPLLLPIQEAFGWDPIYVGVLVIYACLVGTLTPPLGITLFATRGAADFELPFEEIVFGVLPFVLIMVVILFLLFTIEPLAIGLAAFM